MIRRRLTLKRVDPWSVLKFGFVVNIAIMLVAMLGFWILWIVIGRLGLVDQFCDSVGSIVLDLEECSLNGGNIFRTLLFLGVLGVVVQTGIMVFGAFLYNLIADLTGGLGFSFLDESADAGASVRSGTTGSFPTGSSERDATGARTGAAAGAAASSAAAGSTTASTPRTGGPPDQSSTPRRTTPDGPPPAPSTRPDASRPTPTSASPGGPSGPQTSSSPTTSSSPSSSRPDGEQPRRSGGPSGSSLWGDPGRSDDRG